MTTPSETPIQRALAKFDGSPTKLAAALTCAAVPVSRQNVEHWLKSDRVPERHVRALHTLAGIPAWEFCPQDWWRIWPDLITAPGAPAIPKEPATTEQGVA